jgi:hypothetical protein
MENNKRVSLILVIALIITNFLWAWVYFGAWSKLIDLRSSEQIATINAKTASFFKMFTDDVLMAEQEVNFDTRLKLENAVRDLKDNQVLAQWDKFINSRTEIEAQQEVKKLLSVLADKIQVISE